MLAALGTILLAVALWRTLSTFKTSSCRSLEHVAGPEKEHWFTGNLHRLFKDGWKYKFDLFDKYGGVVKVYGMLGTQQLMVSDPKALYHILVKEPDIYHETDMFVMSNKLVLGEGVIATLDEQHRKHRKMLNPAFSLANMRKLLPTIQPIVDSLAELISAVLPSDGSTQEIDIISWMARGTLEYVARAVLGITLDTLDTTKTNAHADAIRAVNHTALKIYYLRPFVPFVMRNFSRYWRNKLVDWLPIPPLRELREISYLLDKSARSIIRQKKLEIDGHDDFDGVRKDLMTVMLRANMSTSDSERLTDDELAGQINTLLLGGQETTTTALARILYMLAREPDAQGRLRSEIRNAKQRFSGDGDPWQHIGLPYDVLVDLPYLDAIVRETFRMYPPTNMLNRTCTRDAVLPLQFPVRSATGEEMIAIHVPAGTNIIISVLGSNHEKRVWGEDASEWRPDRWLNTNGERMGYGKGVDLAFEQDSAAQDVEGLPGCRNGVRYPGVYGSMMTFLGGGRACIGFKFAEMEIKQVISTLLCRMHFSLPSAVNANGVKKEIYWRMDGLQVPVVRPPHGDFKTMQCPLDVRLVREGDFL
ncbi:cytochrome P450 [Lentinus tigrinus ALCF2SS1-6]|uniref:Cytochrome P450 n=1 Tax=Lentinus tigrinus ALCF2SS1-6 TaxID=1328759 RepID=A0A5C2SCH0_9APHY|nr:cytochrome P450 [Lentinus tigrinus ALCF2SS1-6]